MKRQLNSIAWFVLCVMRLQVIIITAEAEQTWNGTSNTYSGVDMDSHFGNSSNNNNNFKSVENPLSKVPIRIKSTFLSPSPPLPNPIRTPLIPLFLQSSTRHKQPACPRIFFPFLLCTTPQLERIVQIEPCREHLQTIEPPSIATQPCVEARKNTTTLNTFNF